MVDSFQLSKSSLLTLSIDINSESDAVCVHYFLDSTVLRAKLSLCFSQYYGIFSTYTRTHGGSTRTRTLHLHPARRYLNEPARSIS